MAKKKQEQPSNVVQTQVTYDPTKSMIHFYCGTADYHHREKVGKRPTNKSTYYFCLCGRTHQYVVQEGIVHTEPPI